MDTIADAFGVAVYGTTILGAVIGIVPGCANNALDLADGSRVLSVAGSESELVGISVKDFERRLSLISLAVVKTQWDDGSELWHYFPSESKVASRTKYVAVRGNYSPSGEYGLFLRCFKKTNECGYVFRLKAGRVESYSQVQSSVGTCPNI
mgnify:CR=1 FL=1